jgi:hypothetical protein
VPDHDAGVALFRPLYQAFYSTCAGPCGYGNYWACAGHIAWPAAMSPTVTDVYFVYDYSSQLPVGGADVSICNGCPCPQANAPLLAHGPTDYAGFFTLQVPQLVSPTGAGITPCVQVTAQGYLTTYGSSTIPLSEPVVSSKNSLSPQPTWGIPLLTPAAQQQNAASVGYDGGRGIIGVGLGDCLYSARAESRSRSTVGTH